MKRCLAWIAVPVALFMGGCAAPEPAQPATAAVDPPTAPADELPSPFTSEQIRDTWTSGFRLIIERAEAGGSPIVERWTVIESDADQATIEFVTLDASDSPVGDPVVGQSSWAELRDHARFAPGSARRERLKRESELGSLNGWLYTVNEDGGLVTEYFFAEDLPGAPVEMVTRRGDEVVAMFRQLKRGRIDIP